MALDADDEILQDFLVEASEILEQLNEQLVELEQSPDDADMLNAVFRGFHTIKGGAGFLSLTALVDVCHRAEDVFNLLRNGEKQVTPQLMDTMLPVLDVLNAQFESLRAGEEPEAADDSLLRALEALNHPDGEAPPAEAEASAEAPTPEPAPEAEPEPAAAPAAEAPAGESEDITDEEFEALLDALEQPGATAEAAAPAAETPAAAPESASDDITEEEFEHLLDELHGKGQFSAAPAAEAAAPAEAAPAAAPAGGDEITEDEFEDLLDQLHGKGQFSAAPAAENGAAADAAPPPAQAAAAGGGGAAPPPQPKPKPESKPEPKPQPKKRTETAKKSETHAPQAETTVRVDTKRLDDIMNMVGELVLVRNRLSTLASVEDLGPSKEELSKTVANLDVVTGDLQAAVMKTRMQPIKKVFGRFPRVVRDLARNLKKDVQLVMHGEETDLDKNLVEALADPLVHLVRNSVDHGVEMPDVREAAGKPRTGTLTLAAEQEGDHILLVIEDDGAGMDPEVLRRKAVEKGIMDSDAAARLDDRECFNLVMAPGFSTKTEISDISGRGVGMDVVKTRIAQLNGSIDIDSEKGRGTRISIKVPLTLAIMPTLMVKLHQQTFALPLVSVSEIFHLEMATTNVVDGQLVVMVRGKALPLFYLTRWLVQGAGYEELPDSGHVVVVHVGTQQVGFMVDVLIGQEEVVIKPLGSMLQGTPGMAGATITGDGKIALILDIPGLMKHYARRG